MRLQEYQLDLDAAQSKAGQRKAAPPTIREATFDDYPGISALEARYGLHPKTRDEWQHLWLANPAYHEFRNWPIGWVCEDENGEIVGSINNIPLAYEFEGRRLTTATSRGLVVEIQYRPYCFSLLTRFFNQKGVDLFLNTSINDKVSKLQELFGAAQVPAGTWDRSAFWITNYRGFAESLLTRKQIRGAAALSYVVGPGLFTRGKLDRRVPKLDAAGKKVESYTQFDDRFDIFWQRLATQNFRQLLAVRTREILDWHFKHALQKGQAWVLGVSEGSELVAYAIFSRQDNTQFGLKRMRLVDFQALEGYTDLLKPLLAQALARCRRERVHMLEALGFSSDKQRIIQTVAPYHRELNSWRYFYRASNRHLLNILRNPDVWDPTCFDGDTSL